MSVENKIEDVYSLSPLQEGILFDYLYDTSSALYHEQSHYRGQGAADIGQIKHALDRLAMRHTALRTSFVYEGFEKPLQVVLRDRRIAFRCIGLSAHAGISAQLEAIKHAERRKRFDLMRDELMRATLVLTGADSYELIWTFHHIILDGWSASVLADEFRQLLRHADPGPALPFSAFIRHIERTDPAESSRFWAAYLKDYPIGEAAQPSPAAGKACSFALGREAINAVRQVCDEWRVLPSVFFRTVWGLLISRYHRVQDVVFGTILAGRPATIPGIDRMVGMCINQVPFRIRYDGYSTFRQLALAAQESFFACEQHQFVAVSQIVPGAASLYNNTFLYQGMSSAALEQIHGNAIAVSASDEDFRPDLVIRVSAADDGTTELLFHASVYDDRTIREMACNFVKLVRQACWQPEGLLDDFIYSRGLDEHVIPNDGRLRSLIAEGLHQAYWLAQFAAEAPPLQLPSDLLHYAADATHTQTGIVSLPASQLPPLQLPALATVLNVLLFRYTRCGDVTAGIVVDGAVLPLRMRFSGADTFEALQQRTQAALTLCASHSSYTYEALVQELALQKKQPPAPLFSVMLCSGDLPGGHKPQLAFLFSGETFSIAYNAHLFSASFMQRMLGHFRELAKGAAAGPLLPVQQLPLLTARETHQLLQAFNRPVDPYPYHKTLHGLFEEKVRQFPDKEAVVCDGRSLTYAELNAAANKLARHLLRQLQLRKGEIVGMLIHPGEYCIIALLGIMKAGGVYLPVDPAYPPERREFILRDACVRIMLTDSASLYDLLSFEGTMVALDIELPGFEDVSENVNAGVQGTDIAYTIYTSGSTGLPKGVVIEHHGCANMNEDFIAYCDGRADDRYLQLASLAFDSSLSEIFLALHSGGTLVIYDRARLGDLEGFMQYLESNRVNAVTFPPALLRSLDRQRLRFLRWMITAGEKASVADARECSSFLNYFNAYGPTECSVCVSIQQVFPQDCTGSSIPIGPPIQSTTALILDNAGQLLPIGVEGEICVTGPLLARGYLNRPELTAEKFTWLNIDGRTLRVYRTGDAGLFDEQGRLEYKGRLDHQVKLRGYRIETAEIEHRLLQMPGVRAAAVLLTGEAESSALLAFIAADDDVDTAQAKIFLQQWLPGFMIPSAIYRLGSIPVTVNGKTDRAALLQLHARNGQDNTYCAPATAMEQALAEIWQDVLGLPRIGTHDNFFESGGHSLKAVQIATRVHKETGVKIEIKDVFSHPTIAALAAAISHDKAGGYEAIEPVAPQPHYELSNAQRRLWVLDKLEPGHTAYNIPAAYILEGKLDIAAFTRAFELLTQRHEILRTVFVEVDGVPRQRILDAGEQPFELLYKDLRQRSDREQEARRLAGAESDHAFDLSAGPLLRVSLLHLEAARFLLLFTMHHIISDGWSLEILTRELMEDYAQAIAGGVHKRAPLRIQYKDYAAWQHRLLQSEQASAHRAYWLRQFSGELPVLDLPADYPRPPQRTYGGADATMHLDEVTTRALRAIGSSQGTTLFMTLLAGLNALLHRYSGQDDIILGTVTAGRDHKDLENQLGFYVNTIALRNHVDGNSTFLALVGQVRSATLEAFSHQLYPFDKLVDELGLGRNMSRHPLFDVMVVWQHRQQQSGGFEGIAVSSYERPLRVSKFDLLFNLMEGEDTVEISVEYNTALYKKERIDAMLRHLEGLFGAVAAGSTQRLKEIDFIPGNERALLLHTLNETAVAFPQLTFMELFRGQAVKTPSAIAVEYGGISLTYEELYGRAAAFARHLRDAYGIGSGDVVAIMAARSERLVTGVLGILLSGATLLPVEAGYPARRKQHLLHDAGAKLLVMESDMLLDLDYYQGPMLALDVEAISADGFSHPLPAYDIAGTAYIIYTSGSTGLPKGVCVSHANLSNYLQWAAGYYFAAGDSHGFALFTSLSFDLTITSLFAPLISGGAICVMEEGDVQETVKNVFSHPKVRAVKLTPAHADLLGSARLASTAVDIAILGGEALHAEHIRILRALNPAMKIYNEYGPTETTVGCVVAGVSGMGHHAGAIPIGRPVANTVLYVLDDNMNLQPYGWKGELWIGGAGVAQGYKNNDALTAQQFRQNPWIDGGRLYRTGDMVRYAANGVLEYFGRRDEQVKLRGYRIEPGEIASRLAQLPGIRQACVVVKGDAAPDRCLVAFVVAANELQPVSIKEQLRQWLPGYMVPDAVVQVDEIPLTPNGKVDRKALLRHEASLRQAGVYKAPGNAIETVLADIWKEVLGREQVGVQDNFFEIGGHSLRGVQVVSRIHRQLGVKIELRDVFNHETIEALALVVAAKKKESYESIPPVAQQPHYELSHAQRRLWILGRLAPGQAAYNIPGAYVFEGKLDKPAMENAFAQLIARHEILRTVFIEVDGMPRQRVLSMQEQSFAIHCKDLRALDGREAVARQLADAESNHCFDLSKGPLLRASLLQLEDERYIFLFTMHHIISDGWSMEILTREVLGFYYHPERSLPPLRIQYKDYAAWQNKLLQTTQAGSHRDYWLEQFSGELPVLDFPTDYPRPRLRLHQGAYVSHTFDEDVTTALQQIATRYTASNFMVVLALLKTLLYRYTGQTDLIVGIPVAGREHTDLEDQAGLYVNTVAVRSRFQSAATFLDVLQAVKTATLNGYDHQLYPFDRLVEELNIRRDLSRSPVFDIMVNNPDIELEEKSEGLALRSEDYEVHFNNTKFDMSFYFTWQEGRINAGVQYDTSLYHPHRMEMLLRHLEALARSITKLGETAAINELAYLPAADVRLLTGGPIADIYRQYASVPVHEAFSSVRRMMPGHTAIVYKGKAMSYETVDNASGRLAAYCLQQGLQRGETVAVCTGHHPDTIIAMLAVMKAGGVFVCVDETLPRARRRYILSDAACKFAIAHPGHDYDGLPGLALIDLHRDEELIARSPVLVSAQHVTGRDGCYVMYTSGSTGRPKGVLCNHASLACSLKVLQENYVLDDYARYILASSTSFDPALRHIFIPLTQGGELHIADDIKDPAKLAAYIGSAGIQALFAIPTMLRLLAQEFQRGCPLRFIASGSEMLDAALTAQLFGVIGNDLVLCNLYGPTEVCMAATHRRVLPSGERPALIGQPFGHNRVLLLDAAMNLLPPGYKGEICISGIGVKSGYLNAPALTADKFVRNPCGQDEHTQLLYRTGDMGMLQTDGDIALLGRNDGQEKIRGYRIELGEIENTLQQSGLVKYSAAIGKTGNAGERLIAAYCVPANGATREAIVQYLKNNLPDYAMPARVTLLQQMPLTVSGKPDKQALYGMDDQAVSRKYETPRTKTEKTIAQVWQEVLHAPPIGLHDNFFEAGGDSFKALQTLWHFRRHGIQLQLIDLFACQTVNELGQLLKKRAGKSKPSHGGSRNRWRRHVLLLNTGAARETLFIIPGTGGKSEGFHELATAMEDMYSVYGLHMMGTQKGETPLSNIRQIASQNIAWIRKVQPRGPYRFIGHSFGAYVVYEMVRQLESEGVPVEFVAIMDAKANLPRVLSSKKDKLGFVLQLAGDYFESFGIIKPPYPAWVSELREGVAKLPLKEAAPFIGGFLRKKLDGKKKMIDLVARLINVRIYNAHMSYRSSRKITTPVIVFRAELSAWSNMDETLGWSTCAQQVEVKRVTGNHHDMVYRQNARLMVKYLRERKELKHSIATAEPAMETA